MTLDPSLDPDRYDPARDAPGGADGQPPAGPLDPALDPDRYDPTLDRPGQDGPRSPTLPGLLGKGSYEDERSNLTWLLGLVAVFGFLAFVTALAYLLPSG